MGQFTINASVNSKVESLEESFFFNHGIATIKLDPNGNYTLSVGGSEYSEYVNSARRDYKYKPTIQKISNLMVQAYERATAAYTELASNLSPILSQRTVENKLDKLVLQQYTEVPFTISKPSEDDVKADLVAEAEQLFFKTFGRDSRRINEYVDSKLSDAYEERVHTWEELASFHDKLQAQNADKQNKIYYSEYSSKKEELESILEGPSRFVNTRIHKLVGDIKLPLDITLDYNYSQCGKKLDVEVEVPHDFSIPITKATMLSSGKVSVKGKTAKEWKQDIASFLCGLPFYIADKLFNATTNIETLSITVWEVARKRGYLWIVFPRADFERFIAKNRTPDPLYSIDGFCAYNTIERKAGVVTFVDGDLRPSFQSKIDEIKRNATAF